MSVSNLTGTTWVWDDEINDFSVNNSFAINFTSNNANYMYIRRGTSSISYSENGTSWISVYDSGQEPPFIAGWTDNAYKTIEITGGTDATNSDLIAFLEANATLRASLISFNIEYTGGNHTYQAEEGMTWEEWVNSTYNTMNLVINGNYIWTGQFYVQYNYSNVLKTDVIMANATYTIYQGGGSND